MKIDDELLTYLEDLSYLTFSEEEKSRLKVDLKKILDGMESMGNLNTENVTERSHPFDNTNSFREDVVKDSFDRELILKNAPDRDEAMFKAPRTVE